MPSERATGRLSTRRAFLQGASLLAASLVALPPGRLLAAASAHTFKVGSAEVTVISDGIFVLPRSLLLPEAAEADVEALFKAHGARLEIVAETNVTLVRNGATLALIDTGAGPDFMPTLGKLPDRLEQLGIGPDDVTHVVFTHAHADHLWGVVDPFGDGSRWPKAHHVMTGHERDFWLQDGVEAKVPEFQRSMAAGIARRLRALGDVVQVAKAGDEVAPGLSLVATPGHTPGHVAVAVRSGSEEALVLGDALTHAAASFGAPQWRWGSDLDWQAAAATRQRLLDDAAARKLTLIGYHLPWPGVGRAERYAGAYRFVPGA